MFFIQRSRLTPEAFDRVGERLTWAGCDGRYDLPGVRAGRRGRRPRPRRTTTTVRAVLGHLARAGVLAPAPGAARPRRRARSPAAGTAGAAAVLRRLGARGRAGALEPVPRGVGLRRGRRLPPAGAARRTSATPSAARGARGALLRRLRPARPGARGPAGAPCRAGARRRRGPRAPRPAIWTTAILDVVVSARPPVGRTRAVEILRGGRSKVVAQNAYDGLAGYGSVRAPALRGRAGPGRRAARGRDGCAPPAGASPSCAAA